MLGYDLNFTILHAVGSWGCCQRWSVGGHLKVSVANMRIFRTVFAVFASEWLLCIKPTLIFTKDLQLTNLIFAKNSLSRALPR